MRTKRAGAGNCGVGHAAVNLQLRNAAENSRPLAAGEFAGKIVRWGIQPLWLEKSQPHPISQLGHIGDDSDATCSGSSRNALEIFRMIWTI